MEITEEEVAEWEFLKLAKRFARHQHGLNRVDDCMVCEALMEINAGQGEVSDYLTGKAELPF
jgi:hypothetical protein